MKKAVAFLLVVCVAMSLFATGTVKVGGAFNFITGATNDLKSYIDGGEKYDPPIEWNRGFEHKVHGFGFDVSGSYDFAKNLAVWADFNMEFCSDLKRYDEDAETSYNKKYHSYFGVYDKTFKQINIISFGAGVAYKLAVDPIDVKLGGGLFLDRAFAKVGGKDNDVPEAVDSYKLINLGLALYADATYKINKNFGLCLTVMPHIGLYNSTKEIDSLNGEVKYDTRAKGLKLSFAMPVVAGVSYSF